MPTCVHTYSHYTHIASVHPRALPDYSDIDTSEPNAVVLGAAASAFTYDNLNRAFKILIQRPDSKLISLGKGYMKRTTDCVALLAHM